MIDVRADLGHKQIRFEALAAAGLGVFAMLDPISPVWPFAAGANLLVRWPGDPLPLPTLDAGGREVEYIGWADAIDQQVDTMPGLVNQTSTIYWYAMVQMGGGGVPAEINRYDVVHRVFDDAGALLGLMPNAPSGLAVLLTASNRPHLTWDYSVSRQQIAPQSFNIYEAIGAGAFNLATPLAKVMYNDGASRYSWTGGALSAGDVRHYTLRSVSDAGVESLIPTINGGLVSSSYTSVDKGASVKLIVPSDPPEVADIQCEVA